MPPNARSPRSAWSTARPATRPSSSTTRAATTPSCSTRARTARSTLERLGDLGGGLHHAPPRRPFHRPRPDRPREPRPRQDAPRLRARRARSARSTTGSRATSIPSSRSRRSCSRSTSCSPAGVRVGAARMLAAVPRARGRGVGLGRAGRVRERRPDGRGGARRPHGPLPGLRTGREAGVSPRPRAAGRRPAPAGAVGRRGLWSCSVGSPAGHPGDDRRRRVLAGEPGGPLLHGRRGRGSPTSPTPPGATPSRPGLLAARPGRRRLYCDSFYAQAQLDQAEKYRHMTATQAAEFAREAGVEELVLIHFAARYRGVRGPGRGGPRDFPEGLRRDCDGRSPARTCGGRRMSCRTECQRIGSFVSRCHEPRDRSRRTTSRSGRRPARPPRCGRSSIRTTRRRRPARGRRCAPRRPWSGSAGAR